MNDLISCCGTDCSKCYCFGKMCEGCNALFGKVFHAPEGKECPIYYCSKIEHKFENCGECDKLPCKLILETRDPKMSDEEFMKGVEERVNCLKSLKN